MQMELLPLPNIASRLMGLSKEVNHGMKCNSFLQAKWNKLKEFASEILLSFVILIKVCSN